MNEVLPNDANRALTTGTDRIAGASAMAMRIRARDWAATSVGAIQDWPAALVSLVNLVLHYPVPATLHWGPELLLIYNDLYRDQVALDRDPLALGVSSRIVWADAWDTIGPQLERVLLTGESIRAEEVPLTLLRENGVEDTFWAYLINPAYDGARIAGIFNTCVEMTSSVLIGRERTALSNRLNQVLATTSDSIIMVDRDWRMSYLNEQALALLGSANVLLGMTIWDAFPQMVYPGSPFVEHYERAMNEGIAGEFEAFYPQPYNVWVLVHPRPTPEGIVVFYRDITAEREADISLRLTADALRESEEDLRYTIELSAQIPWTAGTDGRILDFGARWMELTGLTREQARGPGWMAVQHPDDRPRLAQKWKETLAGGDYDIEHRIRTAAGDYRWMRSRAYPRRNAAGEIIKWYGTTEDIDTRKRAENTLLITEKLAAVGRLASSIAHEINNPLEAVTNLLYLARTSEGLSDELIGYLDTAERELRRVSAISSQTLRFHKQSTRPQLMYCEELIASVLSIQQGRLVNSGVTVALRKRAQRPVECFEGEIRQVLNNLIGNAIDAMHPGGGRLVVRSREQTSWANGRQGVVLTIADTGPGIPAEVARRIFEPFYTTKGIGGTGLGLWVSAEIVERHHATLRMRSKLGQGTVFTLFLPFDAVSR